MTAQPVQSASTARAVERRRVLSLGLFGAATLGLLCTLAFVGFAQQRLSQAQQAQLDAQALLRQAQVAQQRAQVQVQITQASSQLITGAERLGLDPASWAERRTSLRQAQLPREAVAELLDTLSRSPDRMFGAEEFELSVTQPGEGLFNTPSSQSAALRMTLRGTALIRTRTAEVTEWSR